MINQLEIYDQHLTSATIMPASRKHATSVGHCFYSPHSTNL